MSRSSSSATPHEAKEVDEETFFHSRETGGTVVSTALEEMQRDRARALPARPTGTSTPRRPRTATTPPTDNDRTRRAAARRHPAASASTSPISRSGATGRARLTGSSRRTSDLWRDLRAAARAGAPHSRCARSATAATSIPVFRELFRSGAATRARSSAMTTIARPTRLLFTGADWDFGTLQRIHDAVERDRGRRARPRRLSEPDRGDHRRADARRLRLDRHAAVLQALVVRQALRAATRRCTARAAGPRLRDRHQLQPLHLLHHGGEHARRCRRW